MPGIRPNVGDKVVLHSWQCRGGRPAPVPEEWTGEVIRIERRPGRSGRYMYYVQRDADGEIAVLWSRELSYPGQDSTKVENQIYEEVGF